MYKSFILIILTTMHIVLFTTIPSTAWQVDLEISTPDSNSDTGIASNKLTIGTDATATDGYDNMLDTIALLDGPIQAFFTHPEYEPEYKKLWRDFRKNSLPQEWEIEVKSGVNKPVNIHWQVDTTNNFKLSLIDKDTNNEITMTSSKEYSYTSASETPKRLLLRVTEDLNTSPSTGSQNSSEGKGGGCGYMKNFGKKERNSVNEYGQNTLNMLILIMPLLLPMLYHGRRMFPRLYQEKESPE